MSESLKPREVVAQPSIPNEASPLLQKVTAFIKRAAAVTLTVGAVTGAVANVNCSGSDDVFFPEGDGGKGGKGGTGGAGTGGINVGGAGTGGVNVGGAGTGGVNVGGAGTGGINVGGAGTGGVNTGGAGTGGMGTGGMGTGGAPCLGTEINLQDMAEYEYAQYRGGCTDADRIASSLGGGFTTGNTTLCLEPGDKLVTQVHDNADNNAWQYHLNSGNYLNNVKKVHMLQTAPMDAATANLYCTDALTYTNVNATGDDQDPAADGYKYKADTDGVNIFRGTAN